MLAASAFYGQTKFKLAELLKKLQPMDYCAAVLVKMDFTNFPVSITLQQQHFLLLTL